MNRQRSSAGQCLPPGGRAAKYYRLDPLARCSALAIKPSTCRKLHEQLERARLHLHCHADRAVTLAELAAVARLSQFQLARCFRHLFGEAPIRYHRGLRLARAARFLAAGEGSVAQAAELAGYSDQAALCHAFRKHFGKPPQQWALSGVELWRHMPGPEPAISY
jgi:AraC-like DNA-binding protein